MTSPIDQAFGGQARLVAAMEPVAEEDTPRPGPGAAYIEGGVDDTPGEATYHLTVATPAGTWLLTDVASRYNPGAFGISEDISFDRARAQTLRDGRVVWHLGVTVNRHDSDMGLNEVEDWTIQTALLCSTGPSGRPSCIGPLSTRVEATRESLGLDEPADGAKGEHDFWKKASSLDLSLADTGELTIKIVQGKDMDAAMKALKGTHKIAFP